MCMFVCLCVSVSVCICVLSMCMYVYLRIILLECVCVCVYVGREYTQRKDGRRKKKRDKGIGPPLLTDDVCERKGKGRESGL